MVVTPEDPLRVDCLTRHINLRKNLQIMVMHSKDLKKKGEHDVKQT